MPRRRCIEDDEATTSLQEPTEDDRRSESQEVQCSSVADQPQVVTESSGNVDDIALTASSAPCQPANITFPKRPYSDKVSRSFNPSWYHQYSWLEYSIQKDAAYCFPCRLFGVGSIGHGRPEKAFTVNGFRDWKHATGNKGALSSHNNSYSHKQSVIAWEHFKAASLIGYSV